MPVGATIGAAVVGAGASLYASDKQTQSAQKGYDLQKSMYDQSRADLGPYRDEGINALNSINQLYGYAPVGYGTGSSAPAPTQSQNSGFGGLLGSGTLLGKLFGNHTQAPTATPTAAPAATGTPDYSAFFNSPDYQFALSQGTLALDRSAAARGQLLGGGQLKDLTSFGQGLGAQQYGNYFNRLMSIANIGQNAAAGSASAAQNFGNSGAASLNQIGAAQASGPVGVANALSTLPQNLLYASLYSNGGSASGYPNAGKPVSGYPGMTYNSSGNATYPTG